MTVEVTQSSVRYVGDGAQTVFAYNFRIFTDDNLKVYIDDVLQTIVTDYTVTNNQDETGGTVVFVTAPDNMSDIYFERDLSYQQLLDLIEYDRFPAEAVESALDYIVYLVQQNEREVTKAIESPSGMEGLKFPNPGAGEYIKYSDDGESLETSDLVNVAGQIVPVATTSEIVNGIETATRLVSPNQIKIGVNAHETPDITSVYNVGWLEVVDVLPQSPEPNKCYYVRIP